MGSHACVSSKPSGWWCVLLFLFPSFSSFFFSSFFLSFLFFFSSLLLFSPPLPSLPLLLPILPLTDSNRSPRGAQALPPVLRCQSENFSFCLLAPSSPRLPDSASHRFATLSVRFAFGFFGLSLPPLLPLLNNCPPRGKDETRLLPGPSSTTGGIERCISTMYPSSLPSSTKKALDRALRNTFSFVSLDQWLGKRIAIPILLRSINLIVKRL